jgi:hypothetical protein
VESKKKSELLLFFIVSPHPPTHPHTREETKGKQEKDLKSSKEVHGVSSQKDRVFEK